MIGTRTYFEPGPRLRDQVRNLEKSMLARKVKMEGKEYRENCTLMIDTYGTLKGQNSVHKAKRDGTIIRKKQREVSRDRKVHHIISSA